jgi:hypothetical protein
LSTDSLVTVSSAYATGKLTSDVLNKARGKEVPSDEECEALLADVFRSKAPDATGKRGSLARRASMLGAMREILTRHSSTAYGAILSRCLERTVCLSILTVLTSRRTSD